MSSHLDQIQALIADIDGVLRQPSPRLPWMGETAKDSRRVLERIRTYLVDLHQKVAKNELLPETVTQPTPPAGQIQPVPVQMMPVENDAQQMLQAVVRDMIGLRANLMQPLQADMEALQRERDALIREIRHLDAQRQHQYSLAQQSAHQQQIISEFLQVLMGRFHESLTQQVAQTLNNLENQFLSYESATNYTPPSLEGRDEAGDLPYIPVWDPSAIYGQVSNAPLHPRQRLEQLRLLQSRSDELLMTLDSTIGVVFEALLRNVHGYEESLSKGLEKMHSLGQQGETMFTHLVNHLAQKLGQEAAGFLQSSMPAASVEPPATQETAPPSQTKLPPAEAKKKREVPAASEPEKTAQGQTQSKAKRRPTETPGTAASQKGSRSAGEQQKAAPTRGEAPDNLDTRNFGSESGGSQEEFSPVVPISSETSDRETLEELLMNLNVEVQEEPPPTALSAPLIGQDDSSPAATGTVEVSPAEQEDLDGWLDLLGADWQETATEPVSPPPASNAAGVSAGENEAGMARQLNDLYANLFGFDEDEAEASKTTAPQPVSDNLVAEPPGAAGLDLFEEALFEGFADPGEQTNAEAKPAQPVEPEAQSLEEFLFFEDDLTEQATSSLTVEDLFGETPVNPSVTGTQETAEPADAASENVMEALSDLFAEPAPAAETPPAKPATKEPVSAQPLANEHDPLSLIDDWAAENYIPASPDEELLPTELQEEEPERNLAINNTTLQQLKDDLSSLEGFEDLNAQPNARTFDVATELDLSLGEWAAEEAGRGEANVSREPAPAPPERLPQQDWETATLQNWAKEMAVSQPLAEPIEENSWDLEAAEIASDLEATPEDEALLASVDDWFAQLSGEVEDLPADGIGSNPPQVPASSPNMTLDEAFASMKPAISAPAQADIFEGDWPPDAAANQASVVTEDMGGSTLDDLFASLTEEPPVQAEYDDAADLFEPQDWNTDLMDTEVSPNNDDPATSTLDDLFASLTEDFPPSDESETPADLFPTRPPTGNLTDMLDEDVFPPETPEPTEFNTGKKKRS